MTEREINNYIKDIKILDMFSKIYYKTTDIIEEPNLWENTSVWWFGSEVPHPGFVRSCTVTLKGQPIWLVGLPDSINRAIGDGVDYFALPRQREKMQKRYIPMLYNMLQKKGFKIASEEHLFFNHFYDN